MSDYIDLDMLRDHLGDNMRDLQTKREGDLTWDDTALLSGLQAVAREYNSIPPFIGSGMQADCLPADTNMFLDGAAAIIMERRARKLSMERVSFDAGGITTDPDGPVIDGLTKLAKELRERFVQQASNRKANRNLLDCYGSVG